MTLDDATRSLAQVLRAENTALAAGDVPAAMALLEAKQAAAGAWQAALPGAKPDPLLTATLREQAAENERRLALAITVQSRILEMVAQAARRVTPGPVHYGAKGHPKSPIGALALALRA